LRKFSLRLLKPGSLDLRWINLGLTTSAGVDINLRLGFQLPKSIDIEWNILYTHSTENTADILGTGVADNLLGDLTLGGVFPEDQVVSTMNATIGDFNVIYRMRFISDLYGTPDLGNSFDPCFDATAGALDPDCTEREYTDRYMQHDLYGVYRSDTWLVRLGITNLSNEMQKTDEDLARSNVAIQAGHDTFGRRFTLGFEKQF